jgi:hypothetical protein
LKRVEPLKTMSGGASKKRAAPEAPSSAEVDKCLAKVRELAAALREEAKKTALTPSALGYTNLFEVADNASSEVQAKIEILAGQVINSIVGGNGKDCTLSQS